MGTPASPKHSSQTKFLPLIDNYLEFYCSHNSHTARAKRLDLQKFIQFLCQQNSYSKPEKIKITDWSQSAIQKFVDSSLDRGESPATVSRRLATLKHLARVLADSNSALTNPTKSVKTPKVRPEKPETITEKEIKTIRKIARERLSARESFIRYRNSVLFELLLDTGLRADELRLLKMSQLDPELEWLKAVRTKGRRYRNVYITSELRPILKKYLLERKAVLKRLWPTASTKDDRMLPVFISSYACKPGKTESFFMGAKTLWRAINELSAKTKLHPHLLRHSYATDLLSNSKDIRLVSQALGHSDVRVTMRYTERGDQEIASALEQARSSKRKASKKK